MGDVADPSAARVVPEVGAIFIFVRRAELTNRTLRVWIAERVIQVECRKYREKLAQNSSLKDMIALELGQ